MNVRWADPIDGVSGNADPLGRRIPTGSVARGSKGSWEVTACPFAGLAFLNRSDTGSVVHSPIHIGPQCFGAQEGGSGLFPPVECVRILKLGNGLDAQSIKDSEQDRKRRTWSNNRPHPPPP